MYKRREIRPPSSRVEWRRAHFQPVTRPGCGHPATRPSWSALRHAHTSALSRQRRSGSSRPTPPSRLASFSSPPSHFWSSFLTCCVPLSQVLSPSSSSLWLKPYAPLSFLCLPSQLSVLAVTAVAVLSLSSWASTTLEVLSWISSDLSSHSFLLPNDRLLLLPL